MNTVAPQPEIENTTANESHQRYRIGIVTSIHPDFDARIWKHAKTIRDLGHEVHLVCPWEVPDGSVHEGVHFHTFERVRTRAKRSWQIPTRVYGKLLPLMKHVDIVHFHDFDILPHMTPIRFMKPVVYDIHENYPEEMLVRDWIPGPLKKPLYYSVFIGQGILSRIIRNIVLVSHHQANSEFKSSFFNKIIIRNYATLELMSGASDDYLSRKDAVVFTGSQCLNNGSMLLLDIAERVHKAAPHVIFYAPDRFANPAFKEQFMDNVKARKLQDTVVLLPNVKPHLLVKETLNRGTIAISPNLRVKQQVQGAHNKIYEFMAAGLPVVCSDLPDQVEAIGGSNAGLLAPPEDPQAFADAVLKLVNDRAYAYQLGRNGQRGFREKYNWDSQAHVYQRFYEGILEGR